MPNKDSAEIRETAHKAMDAYLDAGGSAELLIVAKSDYVANQGLVQSFVREFCNDHDPNKSPRWLRGAALDEQDLLKQILTWLSQHEVNNER